MIRPLAPPHPATPRLRRASKGEGEHATSISRPGGPSFLGSILFSLEQRGMRGAERAPRLKHKKVALSQRPARLLSPRLVRSSGRSAHASRKEQPCHGGSVPASFSRCPGPPRCFSEAFFQRPGLRRRRRPASAPPVKPCNIGQSARSGARADPSEGCRAGLVRSESVAAPPALPVKTPVATTDPQEER